MGHPLAETDHGSTGRLRRSFLIHQLPVALTVDFSITGRGHVTAKLAVVTDLQPTFPALSV